LLLTPHRVFATKDERSRYQVQWVARMEAANQLVVGLIEHGASVSDLSRPALWRKTPSEEHPFIFIGFHGFYDDLEQMAIRRRVFIQASAPAKARGVDKTMNDCREWRENLRQQLMLLLFNMLLLRENHDVRANKDYTLRAPAIIQYEQIDQDITRLYQLAHRKDCKLRRAIQALPRYLSYRAYNQPKYLKDLPEDERRQWKKNLLDEDDEAFDDHWRCSWDEIPVEVTKVLQLAFERGFPVSIDMRALTTF
jgi:hypothetical protein